MFTARYVLHSTFCPHSVFMCFVWISEQTAIISLYSIDWLVFITETECVYCAVRIRCYIEFRLILSIKESYCKTTLWPLQDLPALWYSHMLPPSV